MEGRLRCCSGDTQHFTLVSINKCSHVKQASIFLENDQFIFRYMYLHKALLLNVDKGATKFCAKEH